MDAGEKEKLIDGIMASNSQWIRGMARDYASLDTWQDLEQEIYLALWQSLDRFAGRSSLSTWVYSVVQNTVRNFARKNRMQRERFAFADTSPAGQDHYEIRILTDFIEKLNETDRQVFLMYLDDISYREISAATGIPEPNLRKRLSRIKEHFKAVYSGM